MAGGVKGKQISRHFEYGSARHGWILFLQTHQAIPAAGTTGVNGKVSTEAADEVGGGGQLWAFLPENN